MSFITAARQEGAKALLGAFAHMGKFDSCLKALTVVDVSEGFVRAHLPVTREVCKTTVITCNKSFALKNKYNSILIHIRCFKPITHEDACRSAISTTHCMGGPHQPLLTCSVQWQFSQQVRTSEGSLMDFICIELSASTLTNTTVRHVLAQILSGPVLAWTST